MKIIILAGGGGTRLFPLSRTCFPKQFMKIGGNDSLLTQTVKRFLPLVKPADILIVTNKQYMHHVKSDLVSAHASEAHILLEPEARNTAPAIALAARYCQDVLKADHDEVLFISPADHVVSPIEDFIRSVREGIEAARLQKVVTFGIKPTGPETGYGYIQAGKTV